MKKKQINGLWIGEQWWYFEIGQTFVGVMACEQPSLEPKPIPGFDFAFLPTSDPLDFAAIEAEIKAQIQQRWSLK